MQENIYAFYSFIVILSYLIGSVPYGLVLGGIFKVGDIRKIGSGNIGATNALRTGNKKFALAVLFCDAIKGAVAIWISQYLGGETYPHAGLVAGLVAVFGHIFPLWLKFKGGKGVATCAGVLLALHWPAGLLCLVIWILTAKLSRYSSMGAIMAAVNAPLYALATQGQQYALPFAFLGALLLWTHRENIKRLSKGEESVITVKK